MLSFTPEAEWLYTERLVHFTSVGLGQDFDAAVDSTLDSIRSAPRSFAYYEDRGPDDANGEFRVAYLRRFRTVVLFRIGASEVLVLAVGDARRGREFWERHLRRT